MDIHRGGGDNNYILTANSGGSFNPADATTYFFGSIFSSALTTSANVRKIIVPKAGIIVRIDLFIISAVAGSSEQSTINIRLNNTTDTVVSNAVDNSVNPTVITNSSLSIAVIAGDYLEFKWVTPTWVTNPTTLLITGTIYII